MNWHGDWNSEPGNYGINAIFFENYWNSGSPANQARYFDNIIISTERIGDLFDGDFGNGRVGHDDAKEEGDDD